MPFRTVWQRRPCCERIRRCESIEGGRGIASALLYRRLASDADGRALDTWIEIGRRSRAFRTFFRLGRSASDRLEDDPWSNGLLGRTASPDRLGALVQERRAFVLGGRHKILSLGPSLRKDAPFSFRYLLPDSLWSLRVAAWLPVFHLYSIHSRLRQNSKTPRCLMCQDQPSWRSMLLISQ